MASAVSTSNYQAHSINRENAILKINSTKPYEGGDTERPLETCHSHLAGSLLLIARLAKIIVNNET